MTLFDASQVLVDAEARATITGELGRNLFVEAGAGTGKTTVLVGRVVNLFASGVLADPSALVAITFTEAAAGELRDRIRRELDVASDDRARSDDERARCAAARRRIDEAVITTLHGFAQRILAEYPVEAGLPPRFDVDDGVLASVRFAERWTAFLDDLYGDDALARDLLIARALGLTSAHLLDIARRFHERWDRVVAADLTPRRTRPAIDAAPILESLRAAFEACGDRLGSPVDRLAICLHDELLPVYERLTVAASDPDDIEVLRVAPHVPKPPKVGQKAYWGNDKALIIEHLGAARSAAQSLVQAHRAATIERLLPALARFTAAGVDERRERGVLEFHDLLVFARDMLRANPAVRVALADRFQTLLIDEFQDTDPLQLDIAFLLAAADPAAPPPDDWRAVALAEGKLLIVGDPKQSIYGFRGADISVWDEARSRFEGNTVQLAQNFRTVPTIVEWVNGVFAEVIGEGRPSSQPPYQPLAAAREPVTKGPAVVLLGGPDSDARIDDLRTREAADIARLVRLLRDERWQLVDQTKAGGTRPVRFADVAILLPTRTALGHIERALDGAGVPYRIESRSLVWATDIVRDLLAVLAAIDDPSDDVAVVAALRSPGFACSDVDLLDWRAAGGRWDHRRDAPETIADDHPVAHAMAALRAYHAVRNDGPVNLLVERIVRERHLVELTFGQRRPRDHWRRLRFVIDQARAFVEAGGRSLGEFVAWAAIQTAEGATVVETPAPEADDDAVRILTIHGSKGLEFPVVVLTGLGTRLQLEGPRVVWAPDRPEVAVGPKDRRFSTPGFGDAAVDADRAALDEGHRLLYVAATRARDHLVVGLTHNPRSESHARALWQVATDDDGAPLAKLARRVQLADQLTLTLPDVVAAGDGSAAAALAERDRWLADQQAVLAEATRDRVLSPTALAGVHDEWEQPAPSAAGADDEASAVRAPVRRGGTAVGRAVHAVLELVDLDGPADTRTAAALIPLARHVAASEGVGDLADEIAALAASALAAPSVRAAAGAKRRWRELPVAAVVGEGRLLEGVIDLLYERDDGSLVVVDHKTDRERQPERHRVQLAAYALALEQTVGVRPARAVLVYADLDEAYEHELPDLAAAVEEVRAMVGAPASA